jgi:short-subunit dehydrogenase
LHGFYESLRAELTNENIQVLIVCPGRVKTNISLNALKADGNKHNTMDVAQEKGIPADVCAKKIIRGIIGHKKELIIAGKEKILLFIRRVVPGWYYRIAANRDPNI